MSSSLEAVRIVRSGVYFLLALALASNSSCAGPAQEQTATEPTLADTSHETVVESQEATAIPETPAGSQIAWVLQSLERGGQETPEEEVLAHVTEHFAEAVPPADLLAGFAYVIGRWPAPALVRFEGETSPTLLVAILLSENGQYLRLSMQTEDQEPYRIAGMRIQPAIDLQEGIRHPATWSDLEEALRQEAEEVSFLAAELVTTVVSAESAGNAEPTPSTSIGTGSPDACAPVFAIDADLSLAIGSAFKLYILLALGQRIAAGDLSWEDLLTIRDELKSLPTGQMQDEDAGSAFSLRRFAELMISISDNTATDHLLFHLGRDTVEQAMAELHHRPEENRPFMATREMFALKLMTQPDQLQLYLAMSADERRDYLDTQVALVDVGPALAVALFWKQPRLIRELEWFASADDLCQVMGAIRDLGEAEGGQPLLDILSINPGLAFDSGHWPYIGYKGGSEPGVLNLTWLLRRDDGRFFVLTASLNDTTHDIDLELVTYYLQIASELLYGTP